MADFRQLALDFVLEDDETKSTEIAKKAALELQSAEASSNPVARWVEAVQPWMPGNGDESAQDTPDWTSRAKALQFLSQTLDFLGKDLLKPSQIKLLVAFFGAMFDVDHKAGILASAKALSQIILMKSFLPASGYDIIQKVCTLGDDFHRQMPQTRLVVFELMRSLITSPEVAKDLQKRDGSDAAFVKSLLGLSSSERDPDCLMVWFDTQRILLQQFDISDDVLSEIYNSFKAYYPITLPRASQSGVTPDQLKSQLRNCFSSTYRLAPHAFPFLVGKLDQGDGVTVNVKVDVLKTIRACLEQYENPEDSITPYVNRVWSSLKYEVRNGEIEDTMWATLEVLKALATRLNEDNLRDYTLTVTRDCVNDLSNPAYTAPSGRLLISVLSASPAAFVLMVAPIITHIKENLRRPKSPAHAQDLFKLLFVILETRILLVDSSMKEQDRGDFGAIDGIFKNLYNEVYKSALELARSESATPEDIKTAAEAVQGVGALASQRMVGPLDLKSENVEKDLLLPGGTSSLICQSLFAIIAVSLKENTQPLLSDELVNETSKALQRSVTAYSSGFALVLADAGRIVAAGKEARDGFTVESIEKLASLLAYVGCSELPYLLAKGLNNFLLLTRLLVTELNNAFEEKLDPQLWCGLVAGLQTSARYLNDACVSRGAKSDQKFEIEAWKESIVEKYSLLNSFGSNSQASEDEVLVDSKAKSVSELRDDFLLISLYVARHLYRGATVVVEAHPETGRPALRLSESFSGAPSEYRYLQLVADFASFVLHEFTEDQQLSLKLDEIAITLFQTETVAVPKEQGEFDVEKALTEGKTTWGWLIQERVNTLTLGLLEALRPSVVSRLFNNGVAQELLFSSLQAPSSTDPRIKTISRSILTILSNKHKIETIPSLTAALEKQLSSSVLPNQSNITSNLDQASAIIAIVAGMARRSPGKQINPLIDLLLQAPSHSQNGRSFAQRLEMIVAPQRFLTKEGYAIVKPLWLQKIYTTLVKPMLSLPLPTSASPDPSELTAVRTNYNIAVLLMLKHIPFSVYEDDAAAILRTCISLTQNLGSVARDTLPALEIIKTTLAESPATAQEHLKSLVSISISTSSTAPAPRHPAKAQQQQQQQQRPQDGGEADGPTRSQAQRLALEVLASLPHLFEPQHLHPHAALVRRHLSLACGNPVREIRRVARVGRAGWAEL